MEEMKIQVIPGRWSPRQPATPRVQLIAELVQPMLEYQIRYFLPIFGAGLYRTREVINGTDNLVMIQPGSAMFKNILQLLFNLGFRG